MPADDAGLEQGSVTLLPDTYVAMCAVVAAARWIEEDGWTPATRLGLMDALTLLPAERIQAAQPKHDPPIEGESNVDHALHCVRCQSDNRRGPVGLRQAAQPEGEPEGEPR